MAAVVQRIMGNIYPHSFILPPLHHYGVGQKKVNKMGRGVKERGRVVEGGNAKFLKMKILKKKNFFYRYM